MEASAVNDNNDDNNNENINDNIGYPRRHSRYDSDNHNDTVSIHRDSRPVFTDTASAIREDIGRYSLIWPVFSDDVASIH
jgi:hypothetical protein